MELCSEVLQDYSAIKPEYEGMNTDETFCGTIIHVNLYGMPVSLTDFHPFRLLTGVHLKSYGL